MKIHEILNEDICAPQAIARTLGLPYNQVMDTCVKFKLWRKRFGMRPIDVIRAIKQLGWEVKDRADLTVVKKYAHNKTVPYHGTATLNQVLQRLEPNKKYIISLKNHTIAYVDGRIIDDENYGKKHKVTNVLLNNGYSLISDIEQTVGSKMVWQKLIGQYDLYLTDMSDQPVKKIKNKRDFEQAYIPKSGYSKIIAT